MEFNAPPQPVQRPVERFQSAPPMQPGYVYPAAPPAPPARKRRHIFRWAFLAVQAGFVIWIIAGAHAASSPSDCSGLSAHDCQAAANAGTAIGVGLIIVFWILLDLVLLVSRIVVLLSRKKG
ncbi:MAG TPA: hypothetical protein VGH43_00355 [Jatrophihabitans sp.]|jgi:hypothetical protein